MPIKNLTYPKIYTNEPYVKSNELYIFFDKNFLYLLQSLPKFCKFEDLRSNSERNEGKAPYPR